MSPSQVFDEGYAMPQEAMAHKIKPNNVGYENVRTPIFYNSNKPKTKINTTRTN